MCDNNSIEMGCAIHEKLKECLIGLQGSSGNRRFHYYNSNNHNQTYQMKQKNTTNIYNHMESMGTGISLLTKTGKESVKPLKPVFALCCFDSEAHGGYEYNLTSVGVEIPLKEILALNCNPQDKGVYIFESGKYEINVYIYLKEKAEVGFKLLKNGYIGYFYNIEPENPTNVMNYNAISHLNKYDTISIKLYSKEEKAITLREDIGISLFINKISD